MADKFPNWYKIPSHRFTKLYKPAGQKNQTQAHHNNTAEKPKTKKKILKAREKKDVLSLKEQR